MLVHVYLAPGFEEVELVTVVDILRRAGINTQMIALDEKLSVPGAHQIIIEADQPFGVAEATADMIILPGGGPGTQALKACTALHERLRAQASAGRRIAAVCAAPTVLAHAGILQGKRACCYPGCENELAQGGAIIETGAVTTDGLVTTSRGAGTSAAFAFEIVSLLINPTKAQEISKAMLYL